MIYFAQLPTGAIKIGKADDVGIRLAQLEQHYRQPLALLHTMEGGREVEREVHRMFAHLRFPGGRLGPFLEQFRPALELMEFIGLPVLVSANPDLIEPVIPIQKTAQIRVAVDVIDLAWKCAPHHGYRGGGAAGDYLSDLLRPILLADEQRRGGPAPKRKPKGGE